MAFGNKLTKLFTGREIININVKPGKAGRYRWTATLESGLKVVSDVRGFDTPSEAAENAKEVVREPYQITFE